MPNWMLTVDLPTQRASSVRRAARAGAIAGAVIVAVLIVAAPPADAAELKTIYKGSMFGFGLHAVWRVALEWRGAIRARRSTANAIRVTAMGLVDALLGSAFKLFVGVFSVPLGVVIAIEAVSTAKRMLTGA